MYIQILIYCFIITAKARDLPLCCWEFPSVAVGLKVWTKHKIKMWKHIFLCCVHQGDINDVSENNQSPVNKLLFCFFIAVHHSQLSCYFIKLCKRENILSNTVFLSIFYFFTLQNHIITLSGSSKDSYLLHWTSWSLSRAQRNHLIINLEIMNVHFCHIAINMPLFY